MSVFARARGRFSIFIHSIRFRLAAWFVLVLAVILAFFSVVVYVRESQAITQLASAKLYDRLQTMETLIRRSIRDQTEEAWLQLPGSSGAIQLQLQSGEAFALLNPSGQAVGMWGQTTQQQVNSVASTVLQRSSGISPGPGTDTMVGPLPSGGYLYGAFAVGFPGHMVGWVLLGEPVDPEGQLARLPWTLGLSGLATLIAAMIGSYWLADRALRPIKAITRTTRSISETDLSRRLRIQTRDEIGELANTFDKMLDRLQAAFIRQRQFTADASHELRTPLTIVGLEASRALGNGHSVDDYRRSLEVIQSENEFMSRLVGELLTLARMDAGQVQLNCEPLDLSDLVLEVAERYAVLATRKGIELQTGELLEIKINADRQYLTQMIGNLVDNAIKYTSGPNRWVRLETGTGGTPDHPVAWVRVSDNGPGIAAEHLPHIFDRFYRIDQARSHNIDEDDQQGEIPGSGLGLSIVQWIAHMHGGQVKVASEPGQGTTFEAELPGCAQGERRMVVSRDKARLSGG